MAAVEERAAAEEKGVSEAEAEGASTLVVCPPLFFAMLRRKGLLFVVPGVGGLVWVSSSLPSFLPSNVCFGPENLTLKI